MMRAKFKAGQVVRVLRCSVYAKLIALDKITHHGMNYWRDENGYLWREDEMRSLTRRECGRRVEPA